MVDVTITAVIKAKNEEANIADCIRSLEGLATDVLVMNDESVDKTAEIARGLGARVVDTAHTDGLVDTLDKMGFEMATGAWIVRMDADERMVPTLAAKLKTLAASGKYAAVGYALRNVMFGDWPRYGGWFRNDRRRFFRSDAWDRNWDCAPHTEPAIMGEVCVLPECEAYSTFHDDYDSVGDFTLRTLHGYAQMEARARMRSGLPFSVWRLLWWPVKKFVGRLIVRQGWRDGPRGVILAGLLACNEFLVEAYVWDLQRRGVENQDVSL